MALLIGQPIDARELEKVTSQWSPDRFAAMCDALAWAAAGRLCPSLPEFTNRVNARDRGVDAEWFVDVQDDQSSISTPIVGPGWNVFQYKKRDLLAQDRRRVISHLKSSLKGTLNEIIKHHGRTPNRYILFVNVDLKGSDKTILRESILEEFPHSSKVMIEVISAAELAALLNNHPHLRAGYFAQNLSFKPWKEAYDFHRAQKLLGSHVELIGREEELGRLKSHIDDPRVRVIALSGPHDIGKSRLALEATKHRPHDVVVALDPRSMMLNDYSGLTSNLSEVVCIVDDPETEDLRGVIEEALTVSNLKLLITLPNADAKSDHVYGLDERVQSLHLGNLSEENARKLLRATGFAFDYGIEEWIINHAAGIPGVILAAASVGSRLRGDSASFAVSVGREFGRRIEEELGPEALRCARLFSVLEHTGVHGAYESEVELICDLFGDGWRSHDALSWSQQLEKAGLAKRGGSFVGISIPLLANYLAGQLLQGHRNEMFLLFARLSQAGQIRFLKRLAQVKQVRGNEVEQFWDEIFAPQGLLGDLASVLKRPHLARIVAGTVPNLVLSVLESGLLTSSKEERLSIQGSQRRELMWALEQLLFRGKTSKGALRLVWLLAEAENEKYANNATGVLEECFHPLHPQMPLSLEERLALIHEFISESSHPGGKQVAISAIRGALKNDPVISLRRSSGLDPLDSRPPLTYGEIWNYLRTVVDALLKLAQEDSEISVAAKAFLPEAVAESAIQGSPREGIENFRILSNWVQGGRDGIDVSQLLWAMSRTRESYVRQLGKPEFPPERRKEFQEYVADLGALQSQLETSSFTVQLKRWAGRYGHFVSSDWERAHTELDKLAAEAVNAPHLLSADLLKWLLTSSATEHRSFFFSLGKRDTALSFLGIIAELATEQRAGGAFASYFAGWAERDLLQAERELDRLANFGTVTGEAIVEATSRLGPTSEGIERIHKQIVAQRVDPEFAAAVLGLGRRLDSLQPKQLNVILKTIAGEDLRYASSVIDLLDTWLNHQRPLDSSLKDFAWLCLERGRAESSTGAWHFDELAAKLTGEDSERSFQLLERLLSSERLVDKEGHRKKLWDPFALDGGEQFWKALYNKDQKRLIGLLIRAAKNDALIHFHLSWRMKELINQSKDKDVLLEIAKEDVELARIIASWMTTAGEGFWPLAFELHQLYPHDEELHNNLVHGIQQMGSAIYGPMSQFYNAQQLAVERILQEPSTPASFRAWLREVIDHLGMEISSHIVWEYDRDVNDLQRYIQDKDSTHRTWAIGRVLKYADWKDIRRLLSVEDIEEVLPQIDLPNEKRKMLEQALAVWRHGK